MVITVIVVIVAVRVATVQEQHVAGGDGHALGEH